MEFLNDPEDMTPEQRLGEVAAIVAAGLLRMRASKAELAPEADVPAFTEKRLDRFGGPRPLCVEGLTGRDPAPVEVSE